MYIKPDLLLHTDRNQGVYGKIIEKSDFRGKKKIWYQPEAADGMMA